MSDFQHAAGPATAANGLGIVPQLACGGDLGHQATPKLSAAQQPAPLLGLSLPCSSGDNVVAIDLITEHIRMKLQQHDLRRIFPNLEVCGWGPSMGRVQYSFHSCCRAPWSVVMCSKCAAV